MTTHGTVFGHDKSQDVKLARKFSAFSGTTWLRHEKAIMETGQAFPDPDIGLNGRTLKVVINENEKGLQSMIVQVDDFIGAVSYVKEKTLLAALLEREALQGESDDVARMALGRQTNGDTNEESERDQGINGDDSDRAEDGSDEEKRNGSEGSSSAIGEDTISSSASTGDFALSDVKLSKIRILEIRAETMANAFKEEICGPEFRMPLDFR